MAEHFEYINLKNKKLRGRSVIEWMLYYEPTERIMLWIISNYKEAFNPKHFLQYAKSNNPQDPNDHKLKRHLEMLQALKGKGLIKQDGDLNYHVTLKGQLYRLTTHPGWPIIPVLFAGIVAFTIFGLNKGCSTKQEESKSQTLIQTSDSSEQNKVPHIQTLIDSGSSLGENDTSKTKDTTTKH